MADLHQILNAAAAAASAFQSSTPGTRERVWRELAPWVQRLAINASSRWLPKILQEVECQVPQYAGGQERGPCDHQALVECDQCGRSCCLDHSRVDQHGAAICYLCIQDLIRRRHLERAANGTSSQAGPWHDAPPPPPHNGAPASAAAEQAALRAAYRLLGVEAKCSQQVLDRARKKLMAKWHPDRASKADQPLYEAKFKEVNAAYNLIMKHRQK
jgi:hypothetical protein